MKLKSCSGDKLPTPHPHHCCGNVQQSLFFLWDPVGVIQGARRKPQEPHCLTAACRVYGCFQVSNIFLTLSAKRKVDVCLPLNRTQERLWFGNSNLRRHSSTAAARLSVVPWACVPGYFLVKSSHMDEWWWFCQMWVGKTASSDSESRGADWSNCWLI